LSDADDIFDNYAADPEVTRYVTWRPYKDRSEVAPFFRLRLGRWDSGEEFSWAITKPREDRVIGMVGCRVREHAADVGYVMGRSYWGRGYTTEATKAIVDWAGGLEFVCRVWAVCDVENIASSRVLQPRPSTVETLARLKNEGYKNGLLSNCSIEIPILWSETSFADLIENPIFACRERLKKPDTRIYHLACERLGAAPKSCLYIADGENYELAAAAKFGLHPVLIRISSEETISALHQEAKEWEGATITSLPEVLQLVDH